MEIARRPDIPRRCALLASLLLLSSLASAGDEFWMPELQPLSSYDSTAPKYQVVGLEVRDGERTLYVVADSAEVLDQESVNRIIQAARRRTPDLTRIMFYTAVHDKPNFPAFAIYEHLAAYDLKKNRTYFGVAAKDLYGGWIHGPLSSISQN